MNKKKDPGMALETIQKVSHLLQKEKERLSPSSPLVSELNRWIQSLKEREKEISQSSRTAVKVGVEFGPKIVFRSPKTQFIVDLRTKLWVRLARKYNSKCK